MRSKHFWPRIFLPDISKHEQTSLNPTCPYHTVSVNKSYQRPSSKYFPVTYQTPIETLSGQSPDTEETPSKHSQLTLQTLLRYPQYTFYTYVFEKRWVAGGRVGGWFHQNNATLWLHLASWNLPDFQLSWKSNTEPSVTLYLMEN